MYSRSLIRLGGVAVFLLTALPALADKHELPHGDSAPISVPDTTLFPGGGLAPPDDPHTKGFQDDPAVIADGQRLFIWYNCAGCHFHGSGGIGPALMDDKWIYGGRIDQIAASIYQGRPNGMPTWGGKIPNAQIWEIAAYVHSLADPALATGRDPELHSPAPPYGQLKPEESGKAEAEERKK